MSYVSRAGQKVEFALDTFAIDVTGLICADLGSNAGGFVDCLLQRGAAKVYAVDTGYGALDWKLRNDPRVVVKERTNAIHVRFPEQIQLVTIDVGWTPQRIILSSARGLIGDDGNVISLIKPHYEAEKSMLRGGVLREEFLDPVLERVKTDIAVAGFEVHQMVQSPIKGRGGNIEMLAWLRPDRINRNVS